MGNATSCHAKEKPPSPLLPDGTKCPLCDTESRKMGGGLYICEHKECVNYMFWNNDTKYKAKVFENFCNHFAEGIDAIRTIDTFSDEVSYWIERMKRN